MTALMIGIMTFSAIVSIASTIVAIYAWVELKSFMKSTHKIEYVPFMPELDKNGKEKAVKESDPLKEYGLL